MRLSDALKLGAVCLGAWGIACLPTPELEACYSQGDCAPNQICVAGLCQREGAVDASTFDGGERALLYASVPVGRDAEAGHRDALVAPDVASRSDADAVDASVATDAG